MPVNNRVRPRISHRRCRFCGLSVWNKRRARKHGCCTSDCKLSYQVLIGEKDHELADELRAKHKKYGGSMYTTIRWLNLRHLVFKRDGLSCARCGSVGPNLHVDHIIPVSWCEGGYWKMDNLQVLCAACNMGKGASDEIDWRPHAQVKLGKDDHV